MKKFKYIISVLVLLLTWLDAYTQERPKWTNGYFDEQNNSYIEVVTGYGYDLNDAKEKATKQIIERRSLATGTDAVVSLKNNNVQITSEKKLVVNARIIDEYYEHLAPGEYKVYLLVQTAKNPTLKLEPVTVTDKYPFSARVFIPGMAQIHKGSIAKGACIIAGEALCVTGIIICENQRASYYKKMKEQPRFAKTYNTKSNNWKNGRNICIGAAAALYIYNLIDAVASKGSKRVFIKKRNSGLALLPMDDNKNAGLSLVWKF